VLIDRDQLKCPTWFLYYNILIVYTAMLILLLFRLIQLFAILTIPINSYINCDLASNNVLDQIVSTIKNKKSDLAIHLIYVIHKLTPYSS